MRRGLPEFEAEGKTDAEADVVVARTFGWVLKDAAGFALRSKEATESVRWFRKAAEAGDAEAALGLGGAYASGRGVPKDVEEAARWFRQAAEAGNAEAARRLGIRFLEGLGVERNEEEGIGWFRRALAFEGRLGATDAETDATAVCDVGCFYFDLVGSEEKALPWLRKAAEAGNVEAAGALGGIYANGGGYSGESENPFEDARPRQPNYAEAARWYRQAAEAGDAKAAFELGLLYDEGRGVEKNAAETERWRRKAEELGRFRSAF